MLAWPFKKQYLFPVLLQVSLDQYHTEEEIYQISLQREPRKPVVSCTLMFLCFRLPLFKYPVSVSDIPCSSPITVWWIVLIWSALFTWLCEAARHKISGFQRCDSDTLLLSNNWIIWETPFMQSCVVKYWVHIGNLCFSLLMAFGFFLTLTCSPYSSFLPFVTWQFLLPWGDIDTVAFGFSCVAAELQPCPHAWPQANRDRWVGCVCEAQRWPNRYQKTHREDGRGEFLQPLHIFLPDCWSHTVRSNVTIQEAKCQSSVVIVKPFSHDNCGLRAVAYWPNG